MFNIFEVDDLHPVDFDTINAILDVHHDVIRFDVCTHGSVRFYREVYGQSLANVYDSNFMQSSEACKSLPVDAFGSPNRQVAPSEA